MSKSPEKAREYQQRYKQKPGIKEKYKELNREWIARNRDQYNQTKSHYRFRLKLDALMHYSSGTMRCAHCGYSADVDALCLDHVDDNGAEHRRTLGCSSRGMSGGTTLYERLKALGWQEGLQVLCFNCNTIKELRRKRSGVTSEALIAELDGKTLRWAK